MRARNRVHKKALGVGCNNRTHPKMLKINLAARVAVVNLIFIGIAIFSLPMVAFKIKYGKMSLSKEEIKQVAGGLDIQAAHSDGGFKEAISQKNNSEVYCNQPHPVIGWIDICGSDNFWGFSQTTAKEKDVNTYRILLIGGSVASYIGKNLVLEEALKERLRELSDSRHVEIFNAALPGFKQPQQLAVVNALLASGWRFDSIVNIAGNNEIAFVANHLFSEGYNPLLPYAHPERSLMASKMLYKPQDECKSDYILSWHPISQYAKINCYRNALSGMKSFVHFQPYLSLMKYKDDIPATQDAAIKRALHIWMTSSRSSFAIASVNGIRYLEVIQPSQYLDNSKRFSREENALVRSDQSMKVVGKAYSSLSIQDFGMDESAVLDARYLFVDVDEHVYIDNCCHLNRRGETILAQQISLRLLP